MCMWFSVSPELIVIRSLFRPRSLHGARSGAFSRSAVLVPSSMVSSHHVLPGGRGRTTQQTYLPSSTSELLHRCATRKSPVRAHMIAACGGSCCPRSRHSEPPFLRQERSLVSASLVLALTRAQNLRSRTRSACCHRTDRTYSRLPSGRSELALAPRRWVSRVSWRTPRPSRRPSSRRARREATS